MIFFSLINSKAAKKFVFLFSLFTLAFKSFSQSRKEIPNLITKGVPPALLSFKYKAGNSYRTLSKVHEDVYADGILHHHAEIVTRVSANVTSVQDDGSGTLSAMFMSSENSTVARNDTHFTWGEEYKSVFTRSPRGIYTIDDDFFMPVVRDCPVFPNVKINVGDVWNAEGHEAHDLRRTFQIQKPFKVPFDAQYEYRGIRKNADGRIFYVIEVIYNLYFESPKLNSENYLGTISPATAEILQSPKITQGYSHQILYWDNVRGELDHYVENFKIHIETYYGNTFDFIGTAEAEVTDFTQTNNEETLKKIKTNIENLGLENVSVKKGEKGLTISLDKIQFLADSAILQESEKRKLYKIANILKKFDNDLLVTGHTALRGSEEGRSVLSNERAQSVADFLVGLGVRDTYHVFTRGKGASEPVATNETEEGRAKNRRVEITLMDK